jgi:hypothetical protein
MYKVVLALLIVAILAIAAQAKVSKCEKAKHICNEIKSQKLAKVCHKLQHALCPSEEEESDEQTACQMHLAVCKFGKGEDIMKCLHYRGRQYCRGSERKLVTDRCWKGCPSWDLPSTSASCEAICMSIGN